MKKQADWNAMALLACMDAMGSALGRRRRAHLLARLELVARDWRRPDAPPELRLASRRFLGPLIGLLGGA